MTDTELAQLLEEALLSELGTVVETNDFHRLRQRLYVVRKESERFACLSFSPSPLSPNELWIKKNDRDEPA